MTLVCFGLAALLAASWLPTASAGEGSVRGTGLDRDWRAPARDGANSLYFLLRFHSAPATYEAVVQALGDGRHVSLREIRDAAGRLGLDAATYRCSLRELAGMNEPVIAYMEGNGIRSGSYVVVLNARDVGNASRDQALFLVGGPSTLAIIDTDEFRRGWTGYVLKRREAVEGIPWLWLAAGAALPCLVRYLALGHGRTRERRRPSTNGVPQVS